MTTVVMHSPHLFELICLVLATFPTLSSTVSVPYINRQHNTVDDCKLQGLFKTTSPCVSSATDTPLTDGRADPTNSQCRTRCSSFSHPSFSVTSVATSCTFCASNDAKPFLLPGPEYSRKICVPRTQCVKQCGPERPGCVYTGSCASQTCFKGAKSAKPAVLKRVTHSGWRSVLTVDDGDGSVSTSLDDANRAGVPSILNEALNIDDQCVALEAHYDVTKSSCDSGEGDRPLGYEQLGSGQCRTYCNLFDNTDYEIVRVETGCNACNGPAGKEYGKTEIGLWEMCIPRKVCIEQCGPERAGCVYTGSCRTQLCFSGIDSKKAAVFKNVTDDGPGTVITVDNEGRAVGFDAPAFADGAAGASTQAAPADSEGTSTDGGRQGPPELHASSGSDPPTPSKAPSSSNGKSGNASGVNGNDAEGSTGESVDKAEGSEAGESSKWIWLGPVCGLFGTMLAAGAAIVAAFIMRGRTRNELPTDLLDGDDPPDFAEPE